MTNFIQVNHEIKDVIEKHLEDLKEYVPLPATFAGHSPEEIVSLLERLSAICEHPALQAPCQLYEEARTAQSKIDDFLKMMNYDMGSHLENSEIGHILANAARWLEAVKSRGSTMRLNEVWDMISPVKPDRLEDLGSGLYEAKWWKPVPMMDVEILQRTSGLSIHGEPSEPKHLPGGISVRFSLSPCSDTIETTS